MSFFARRFVTSRRLIYVFFPRRFGTSRRFSELDKREITGMIATQTQTAKEAWRRQLDKSRAEVTRLTEGLRHHRDKIAELNARIQTFVRQNDLSFSDPFQDFRSTTDALIQVK